MGFLKKSNPTVTSSADPRRRIETWIGKSKTLQKITRTDRGCLIKSNTPVTSSADARRRIETWMEILTPHIPQKNLEKLSTRYSVLDTIFCKRQAKNHSNGHGIFEEVKPTGHVECRRQEAYRDVNGDSNTPCNTKDIKTYKHPNAILFLKFVILASRNRFRSCVL